MALQNHIKMNILILALVLLHNSCAKDVKKDLLVDVNETIDGVKGAFNRVWNALMDVENDLVNHISATRQASEERLNDIEHMSFQNVYNNRTDSGCDCVAYNCGCCVNANISTIHLDDKICANVSYLPAEYGVALTVTVDTHTIINVTLSAKNPPPVCVGVPYLEEEASICLDLYDLDVSDSTFHGCMRVEIHLYHVPLEKYDLGCFNMPLYIQRPDNSVFP